MIRYRMEETINRPVGEVFPYLAEPILLAALGGLLVTPRRSFALCLAAGLAGYLVGLLTLR